MPDIIAGLALLLVISGIAAIYHQSWTVHAIVAVIALALAIYASATGAMLKGRIKGSSTDVFWLHRRIGVSLGAFVLGSIIYGIWIRLQHADPILSSVHGRLGLIILIGMVLQIVPSLVKKDRAGYRGLHMVLGYLLPAILVIDSAWGLHIGVLSETKYLVLAHSISGGLAALAFVWIILETMYPTEMGLGRARIASFAASLLVIAGCWIAGGYNYLTDYGSNVKPAILAGGYPWAHQILMEAKEHVFIFLPIIALSLSLTIYYLDDDRFAGDRRYRRAIAEIACMALLLVLLMFLMGAIVSKAGNTGLEA